MRSCAKFNLKIGQTLKVDALKEQQADRDLLFH